MSLSLWAYQAAVAALEPFAPLILRARAASGLEDKARLGERLGRAGVARPDQPVVWLHGASVGEILSLLPLAERIGRERPDLFLLMTSGTTTSARLLSDRLPANAVHQYAPIDGPASVRRFLDFWRPRAVLFAEGELWPNLLFGARMRGAKIALVSARMTEKSARGWRRSPRAAKALLDTFDLILPQDRDTIGRLESLGAFAGPLLNLKLTGEPLPFDARELKALKKAAGTRKVVLAASTHPGEEEIVAQAVPAGPLLIIAPRHPERRDSIVQALKARGRRVAVRSAGDAVGPQTDVYLADTLGEMGLFMRLADVVVLGGSLVEDIGGHNPLEPARLAAPIVTGPYFHKNEAVFTAMAEAGAVAITPPEALGALVAELLDDADARQALGQAGAAYAARQSASIEEGWALIRPLLPPPGEAAAPMPRGRKGGRRLKTPRWWYQKDPDYPPAIVILRPLSWMWAAVTARRIARTPGFIPPVPVICVGNLTIGGAGKTPVARALAERLQAAGRRPHILATGHLGRHDGPVKVDPLHHTSRDVGDEPLMLARDLPVWVAKNRPAGVRAAAAAGADCIIMDDGHQNPSIAKTVSLVVVDGETRDGEWPFGDGSVAPAGPLREPLAQGLARAQAVVLLMPTDADQPDPGLARQLAGPELLVARMRPCRPPPPGPQLVFAGIGKPWKVERSLRAAGCRIADFTPFPDHAEYGEATLRELAARAEAAGAQLLTTEKDWVRLPPGWRNRVAYWPIEVRFDNEDALNALLASIPRQP